MCLILKITAEEQLQQMEDVGIKVAGSIYRFFHDEAISHMLEKLGTAGHFTGQSKKTGS